jgi:hypothetical protein
LEHFFDEQYPTGSISNIGCGIGYWLEAILE